jgi:cell fate (sporulation/competence/biofilm development) regulator YmcA (YheA/YmcA/DUF963 family)
MNSIKKNTEYIQWVTELKGLIQKTQIISKFKSIENTIMIASQIICFRINPNYAIKPMQIQ